MTGNKKTNKFPYPHVNIEWVDICQSEEAWINESEILNQDLATCHDTGYIYKKTREKLWLFSSYSMNDDGSMDVGTVTVIPTKVIKKIERIK